MSVPEMNLVLSGRVSREDVDTIKRTVAPDATDVELKQFLHLSVKYGLDPMAREIYFSKMGGRPSIIVGRDGYLKVAMADPNFDGLQSYVVKEGDHFEIDVEANKVIHRFGAKRGEILGAWAMARHKRRSPVICFVDFREYRGNTPIWTKYPSAMIQKVAEVFVLRRQFNISGLVAHEEIGMPEEARYGAGPAIDQEPGQPIPVEVQDAAGKTVGQTTATTSPKGYTASDTLSDMKDTNTRFAEHLQKHGSRPEAVVHPADGQAPPADPGVEEPEGGVPGEETFPTNPDPVPPTDAQVKALNKAWDTLGAGQESRTKFLGVHRPWAKWEAAIESLEAEIARRLAEKVRGETMAQVLALSQQKKVSAPGIVRALWPDHKGTLKDLTDKQLAELLRKVQEA